MALANVSLHSIPQAAFPSNAKAQWLYIEFTAEYESEIVETLWVRQMHRI